MTKAPDARRRGRSGKLRESRGGGPAYLYASALVKVYLPEAGSLDLDRAFYGRTDMILSDLAVTEVASALARRCREGVMKPVAAKAVVARILREQDAGVFAPALISRHTHRSAERLLMSLAVPLRAADALHVALALQEGANLVVTYDGRLAAAAVVAGLGVWPTSR